MPGIYAIGQKVGSKPTKYRYGGRTNNIKRRLLEHKSGRRQAIDKMVTSKFKQKKESELRIKYVREKRHKANEAAHIDCLAAKEGYSPTLNKRRGDGGGGKARSSQLRSLVSRPSNSVMEAYDLASLIWEALYG